MSLWNLRERERHAFRNCQQNPNLKKVLAIPKNQASCELPRSVVIARTVSRSDPVLGVANKIHTLKKCWQFLKIKLLAICIVRLSSREPHQEAMCFRNCQQIQILNKCWQFLKKSSCVRVVSVGCHHANRIKERSCFRNCQQNTNLKTALAIPKNQASCELPRSVVIMRTVSRSDPF